MMDTKCDQIGRDVIVSADELLSANFQCRTDDSKGVYCSDYENEFAHLLCQSADYNQNAYLLFAHIAKVRVPQVNDHFDREISAEQMNILLEVVRKLDCLCLKSKIAEIAWESGVKGKYEMAILAIETYCKMIETALKRSGDVNDCIVQVVERACRLNRELGKKNRCYSQVKNLAQRSIEQSIERGNASIFMRLAAIYLQQGITSPGKLARMAKQLLLQYSETENAYSRYRLWEFAGNCFKAEKMTDKSSCCNEHMAACLIEVANDMNSTSLTYGALLKEASKLGRKLPKSSSHKENVEKIAQRAQEAIGKQMKQCIVSADATELVEGSLDLIRSYDLPVALANIVMCDILPDPDRFWKFACDNSGLAATVPIYRFNRNGKLVFKTTGPSEDPKERRDHETCLVERWRTVYRMVTVAGCIIPMRAEFCNRFGNLSSHSLKKLFVGRRFIPKGHEEAFARGLQHFIEGRDMESANSLIPQLENCLRHILEMHGFDTTAKGGKGDFPEDASLSYLLRNRRDELERVLPRYMVQELYLLFAFKGGSDVRNEVAHGMVPDEGYSEVNIVYATWLVIHLAMVYDLIWEEMNPPMPP